MQRLVNLIRPTCLFFFFIFIAWVTDLRKYWYDFMSENVLPMSSSRSFMMSCLIFKSLSHFEFVFVYDVRVCSNFIDLHGAVQLSWHYLPQSSIIFTSIISHHSIIVLNVTKIAKNWLIEKDPDAGKDWRWEEKGTTQDERVEWHHRFNGHEFERALGDGDGLGSLVCCCPWGCKESDTTERLNWRLLISEIGEERYHAV